MLIYSVNDFKRAEETVFLSFASLFCFSEWRCCTCRQTLFCAGFVNLGKTSSPRNIRMTAQDNGTKKNGRIGRMIITLMLWASRIISAPHFYMNGYFEENKDLYIDSMRNVSMNDDWTSWCVFFLGAVEKQAIRNLKIVENINSLYEEMKLEFSNLLASKWSLNAPDFVLTNPVFRNSKFTNNSDIPSSSAARFTRILLENELIILLDEPSGRRPALYKFEPLMRLVRL